MEKQERIEAVGKYIEKYYVPGNDDIELEDEHVKGFFDRITEFLEGKKDRPKGERPSADDVAEASEAPVEQRKEARPTFDMPTAKKTIVIHSMAALLPHKTLVMKDDYEVYADDVLCNDLAGRQTVLQSHCKDSVCVQFDDIKNLKVAALREIFTGKQVVYVYHNQIDARGDKANTEDEVFVACEEAIKEVMELIHRISTNANTYRFIVTSDHGFIYKRDKIVESDKIGGVSSKNAWINRRYIVSKEAINEDGVQNIGLGYVLGYEDDKVVTFPISSNVFKVSGGGQNFVHGGSSPQEMIVPVLDIKMDRYHNETKPAQISLVSMVQKITNLITSMDFIQSEPVSDTVKETTYRLVFMSEDDERISNENIYVADSREPDSTKRIFRMRFNFKNQKYDKNKQYYLVVTDDNTGLEQFRHPVIVDITFADDFGF